MYVCMYIYIYIYICSYKQTEPGAGRRPLRGPPREVPPLAHAAPNLPTNIVDFRGFDSSTILILRGGIPRPLGNFLESLSQAMLVGIMLVGRLGAFSA